MSFDWLVFDEGYGATVPFLRFLNLVGQRFVAEVPVNFAVRDAAGGPARRADGRLTAADARGGRRHRLAHRTVRASFWRAATAAVWVADREHTLVVAVNEATAEVKYFLTNATAAPLARVLAVAFRRCDGGARLPPREAGGRADALRGAGLHRADPAPDPGPGGAGVRGHPHGAAAGGKTRR